MTGSSRPVLALDIGGTKLAVGVLTEDGAVHSLLVEPTRREEGPEIILPRLFDLGRRAREVAVADGLPDIGAVGISCGGPLDAATGVLVNPLHLPGWVDIPIVADAERAFGVPAVLENDATAAALGEYRYGSGRGTSTMLYLTISTGVGGGAVINGTLHRGAAGNGGEYGHILVRSGGRRCLCGRDGCLEAYASGTNIAARATEALESGRPSALRDLPAVQAEDVARAAGEGDPLARELLDQTCALLAVAITDLVNILEPDRVVLGGGVTRAGDALLGPVREAVLRDAMRPAARAVSIGIAELGDVVCVVGAGALALDLRAARPVEEALMPDRMAEQLEDHLAAAAGTRDLLPAARAVAQLLIDAYERGGILYTFGNGGSAADAQHLAGELIGHYDRDRRPLGAVTLTTDSSVMTAIANDYAFDDVFARQVEGLARPGDVVAAFTTSGTSPNVVAGLAAGRAKGATTVLFAGGTGGAALEHADHALLIPSTQAWRIQEMHTFLLHAISDVLDAWADEGRM